MKSYQHLSMRLFNTPLLIQRAKLDSILAAIGPRLGLDLPHAESEVIQVYGPGDGGSSKRKSYYVTEDGIGVIDVMGPLVKRSSGDFMSGGPTTYGEIESEFLDAANDSAIKGILLQVDSPGGESVGCFELADVIHGARASKPIVAVADGDSFSAAYAIASAADQVFVAKSGGVGSVGVWMLHADYSGALEEKKIKVTYIHYGARKIDGNPYQPLADEAHAAFQAEVNRIGEMFVNTVARNRGMKASAVKGTEAGLFFGENGVSMGFADEVGTVSDALAALRRRIEQNAGSTAARSAAKTTKKGKRMENNEENQPADAPNGAATNEAAIAAARAEGFAQAARIVGMCALAKLNARQASSSSSRGSASRPCRRKSSMRAPQQPAPKSAPTFCRTPARVREKPRTRRS
jgi:signal peptide peptidase SppA